MCNKLFHPGRLFLYAVLSLLDLVLTYRLMQSSGGHVYESNPIANAWLSKYGWAGLTAFKMASMGLVSMAAILISVRHPQMGARVLTFACSAVAAVVLYSCSLLNFFGDNLKTTNYRFEGVALQAAHGAQDSPEVSRRFRGKRLFSPQKAGVRGMKPIAEEDAPDSAGLGEQEGQPRAAYLAQGEMQRQMKAALRMPWRNQQRGQPRDGDGMAQKSGAPVDPKEGGTGGE
jgi:hypothetical protein